ncbi:response regulator transcription factor [Cyanobium sp. Morenito 9A2]|uniref:response regulator transcription factor n=1 Tax=Cyanobium sp. Morenito 9A2 TaxID=2823718 RepID=UPI0020CF62D1|nr:response regulator transcription factor [Cyanobium sp. Morenito 9A2]MCP9849999.1 response regulator transcription factor [Cyanobium sp. Morenito 9A2]
MGRTSFVVPSEGHGSGDLLRARGDLIKVLLRPHDVLVCMYPRLLALSLAAGANPERKASEAQLCITSSLAEGQTILEGSARPWILLTTEHLEDGNGLELIRRAKRAPRNHPCLLMLTHNHRVVLEEAQALGTDALVLEDSIGRSGAMAYALERLLCGERFLDPALETPEPPGGNPVRPLSGREVEVLQLVAEGLGNRDIATALQIAPSTARDHVGNILSNLGVKSRAAAAVEGLRRGYLR